MLSRPCEHCCNLIREVGIKTVYYTTNDSELHSDPEESSEQFCSRNKHHTSKKNIIEASMEPIVYSYMGIQRENTTIQIERHKSYGFRYLERLKYSLKHSS